MTRAFLERIDSLNLRLNAFITVTADRAMERAKKREQIRTGKYLGPLHGIPYAAKDCIATTALLTTNGSRFYRKVDSGFSINRHTTPQRRGSGARG